MWWGVSPPPRNEMVPVPSSETAARLRRPRSYTWAINVGSSRPGPMSSGPRVVHLPHLARERREQVAHRLHALDGAEDLARGHRLALARQLHLGDVAQLLDRELRDPDGDSVVLDAGPLVVLGVPQVVRIV